MTTDTERLDALARYIAEEASGHELHPIGPDIEYAEDGNTVVRIHNWIIGHRSAKLGPDGYLRKYATLRDAIDGELLDAFTDSPPSPKPEAA